MKSGFTDSHIIRRYLLGAITQEDELAGIEKRMLSDGTFLSEVEQTETELIEEYFDEALTPAEKRGFVTNFLAAPQRKAKFRFMLALSERASEKVEKASEYAGVSASPKRRGVFLNDWFAAGLPWLAAFGVLILVVGLGFWYLNTNKAGNKVNEGLAALNTAYLKQRPTEVRLSALDYAPQLITRGGQSSEINSLALDKAGLLLVAAVEERPDAESYRALGLYYASRREMDKALDQFDKGLADKPADARFYADHGAVLLETAKAGQKLSAEEHSRRLNNSLSQLDKALKIDGDYLPALFNKALCLEEMNSSAAAREIWKQYLEKDPSSKWAKEAQDHLNRLDEKNTGAKSPEKVLGDFMQAFEQGNEAQAWKIASESKEMVTGTMVSEQLTRGLLSADAPGAPENADRMLSALSFLGRLEKENARDVFFYELAEYYRRADPDQRAKSNRAQLLTREGYTFCRQAKYKAALEKFIQSRDFFAEARNLQEAARTDYWISYLNADGNLNESVRLSESLIDYSRGKSYRWLLGQALTLSSSNYIRQSKFSPAVLNANEALKIAQETSDAYNYQKTSAQLADIYTQLNEPAGALENSQNSLRENGTYFNSPRQTWRNYAFATQLSTRFGLGEFAIAYAQEGVLLARDTIADPVAINNSYSLLSAAYKATQNYDGARNAVAESIKLSDALEPGPTQSRLRADSLLLKAELERPFNCVEALENYDQALSFYRSQGEFETVKTYYALKGQALCNEELGEDQKVEEDLQSVLKLAEDLRAKIVQENSRTSFFADEQSVYEFAAAHALKKDNPAQAFDYIESGKARSLLDDLKRQGPPTRTDSTNVRTLAEIRQELPAGSQVIQYSVLPDKLLIWLVNEAGVNFAEKKIPAAELEALVREFMSYTSRADADRARMKELEAELHGLLIQPVQPFIDKDKELVIVPDKILCFLPFETLRPAGGKYAVEEYQLSYSPSATLFVMLSRQAAKLAAAKGEEKFLGVGNPSFDRDENPNLKNLPAAASEIRSSAAYYRAPRQLIGDEAVKKAVLAALPGSDIFHFAGHYKANDISPQFSRLLLAGKEPASGNDLTAAEIGGLKLNRTKLVVLSACKTAIENYYHGEGAIGIARTFFAVGAPTVVASRWEVDSVAAAQLMTAFHRYRKDKKLSTSAALRAAQIEMLKNESDSFDSPYFWAAFAAIGGIEKV